MTKKAVDYGTHVWNKISGGVRQVGHGVNDYVNSMSQTSIIIGALVALAAGGTFATIWLNNRIKKVGREIAESEMRLSKLVYKILSSDSKKKINSAATSLKNKKKKIKLNKEEFEAELSKLI